MRPRGRGLERYCVVSFSKNINPSLVLVQPMKTRSVITERLLMGHKESNQTNRQQLLLLQFYLDLFLNFAAVSGDVHVIGCNMDFLL